MDTLLAVNNLSIRFRSREAGRLVVCDLSFSIGAGEVLGLVGESGSGKSVTALAILQLLDAAARVDGEIRFDGADLLKLSSEAMRRKRGRDIAMIFQEPMTSLNPVMTIGEQIAEAIRVHQPGLRRAQVKQAVLDSLDAVAMPDPSGRYKDYPHQFSGGQRQRILIAMALINRPRLLIADEPTTALDVTVQAQVLELLKDLQQQHGLAMLFISHDLAVVGQVASRMAVLRNGQIVETGSSSKLLTAPEHPYTKNLLAAVPTLRTDRSRPLAMVQ